MDKLAALERATGEQVSKLEGIESEIVQIIKQAALSGTDTKDLGYVVKHASLFGEYLTDHINDDLKK